MLADPPLLFDGVPHHQLTEGNPDRPRLAQPGEGFDFYTQNHLRERFGFSNICTNWDYSPSRELTGMIYPIFEYALMIYLVLDFINTKLAYQRGELTEWFWIFSKIVFPVNVFLGTQFRTYSFLLLLTLTHHICIHK